jgi:hypothetical protein
MNRRTRKANEPQLLPRGMSWTPGAALGTHVLRKDSRVLATVIPCPSGFYFIAPGGHSTFRKPVATAD